MKKLFVIGLLFFSIQLNAAWVYDEAIKAWFNTETGEIRITGDDDMDGDVGSIFLYTGSGQLINSKLVTVVYNADTHEYTIETSGLEHGDYILVIFSADGRSKVIRFVI